MNGWGGAAGAGGRGAGVQTIRELRQERGWTQFELALAVGVRPQAVYLWESGRRTPQVAQMRKLGELFGLCSDAIALVDEQPGGREAGPPHRPHRGRPGAQGSAP